MPDVLMGTLFLAFSVVFYVAGALLCGGRLGVLQVLYLGHMSVQEAPAIYMLFVEGGRAARLFFLVNSWAAFLMAFIMLVFLFLRKKEGGSEDYYNNGFLLSGFEKNREVMYFYFCFCLLLLLFYMAKTGASPLFSLLSGQLSGYDAVGARLSANAGQQGLIFGMALRFFMPMLFMMGMVLLVAGKGANKFFPWLCILVAFVYTAWAMDKTPVVALFVLLSFYFIFYRQELKRIKKVAVFDKKYASRALKKNKRMILVFFVLAIAYPIFIFAFLPASDNGWDYVAGHIFKRIFFIPALNSYTAIDLFSESERFTFFKDISGYALLAGEEYFNLSFFVASHRGMIEGSYSPPAAIGNFYAQAGMVGVFCGVIISVFVFKFSEVLIKSMYSPSIVKAPAYILLVYGAFRFSWANFHTILATEVIFPAILMVVTARIFFGKRI